MPQRIMRSCAMRARRIAANISKLLLTDSFEIILPERQTHPHE
jgi:hypothetical protein